jgi:RNA polymerase sigma-70 factor, ECF subfamily
MTTDLPLVADADLVAALRAGDADAFAAVVRRWRSPMLALALRHVGARALAEDVVQETWLCVLRGLPGFEGRSSLRTWVFAILANRARSRAVRERRSLPFSALARDDEHAEVLAARATPPVPSAEDAAIARERLRDVRAAIDVLPPVQRRVLTARLLDDGSSEDVAAALGLTRANERVLLHRARRRIAAALA